MKLVIVVPDGLCDGRYSVLNHLSPVEYAQTPGLDALIRQGRVGLARTMVEGLPLGSLVGLLGLLGYDPRAYFPLGRAIFEAYSLGLELQPADMVWRCNIVRVGEDDRLLDFTAGQIDERSASHYLTGLSLVPPFELYHDLSYRNVLLYRNCPWTAGELLLYEPHQQMGRSLWEMLPHYQGQPCQPLIELMLASRRGGLMLWPWGGGRKRVFPPLPYRLGLVTALSFLEGLARLLGGRATRPAGTTGYLGSDLEAKRTALLAYLPEVDVALIHCNAPDEEAHVKNLAGKVQAIEDIDRLVLRPLLRELDEQGEPYRLLFCPDHYTCCQDGKHYPGPVPYVVAGTGLAQNHTLSRYSEVTITRQVKEVSEGYQVIGPLLNVA
jgi:2,3-bisphosphoglycerate-independent phosphoglycerate mutase